MAKNPVFDETYRRYLSEFACLDIKKRAPVLGVEPDGDGVLVRFFTEIYRVSQQGVTGPNGRRPIHAVSVVLLKYFILCPQETPEDDRWVSYRDFKDAAPFVGAFANNTEQTIADNFCGDADGLAAACTRLGGTKADQDLPYDVAMQVYALPRIPLLLLFNDSDDEFSSSCSVLFERRAEKFLDMECLAIVGWLFSDYLERVRGRMDTF